METLKRLYTDASSPAGFAGVQKLLSEARKVDPRITLGDVQDFLETSRTYTLHKPRRLKFQRLRTIPSGFMTDCHADLADFQQFSRNNRGYRFLLVVVDILSRRVFAAPVKTKAPSSMKAAFLEVFRQMPMKPWNLLTDGGKEFVAADMKKFFEEQEINKYRSRSDKKASVAERYIRVIKERIYRYFSETNSKNWTRVLPKVLESLNSSVCRMTGMRPIDVSHDNARELWNRLYKRVLHRKNKRKPRFQVGDNVRLSKDQMVFDKGYLPNYTEEIFRITDVARGNPHLYELTDEQGELIDGNVYAEHLVKTRTEEDDEAVISEALKKRTVRGVKQVLVRLEGYKRARWVDEASIV